MIRDRLRAIDKATEADMLSIQLDDRAVFLDRWRQLLLDLLTPEQVEHDPRRGELERVLDHWEGRAAIDSAGYRLVWEIRLRIIRAALSPLTARCRAADPRFRLAGLECEPPAWALVTQRPVHLLDPAYRNWNSLLLAMIDATLDEASRTGEPLEQWTWGKRNIAGIQHPISIASPRAGNWLELNMPAEPLPGGRKDMPRVQGPTYGASQRMAVTTGRESEGLLPHALRPERPSPLTPLPRWPRGMGGRKGDAVPARAERQHPDPAAGKIIPGTSTPRDRPSKTLWLESRRRGTLKRSSSGNQAPRPPGS